MDERILEMVCGAYPTRLSLAGMGSTTVGGSVPIVPSMLEGGEPAAASPPSIPIPELRTFSAGGHVLGFAPQYLLTANGRHALKVAFLNAHAVTPLSDTPANHVGSAERTLQGYGNITNRTGVLKH